MARVAVWFAPLEVSCDFIDYPYFADLGAVQAAAVLRGAGHDVRVYDALATAGASLEPMADGQVRLGVPVAALLERLEPYDLALVAYTPFHRPPSRDAGLAELLSALRQRFPARPILLADLYQSGQHVVDAPSAEVLASYPEVDGLLRYEAEGLLTGWVEELVKNSLPHGNTLASEPLAATPRHAEGLRPPRAARDGNYGPEIVLDDLPLPAWDLVDTRAYFKFQRSVMAGLGRPHWAFPIDADHLPMVSTRGCPFRCAHCSSNPGLPPGKAKTQRRYSRARLAAQLDWLKQHGARSVHLLDELANVNERHFDGLLELLAERGLNFEIPNGVRADYVLPKHLEAMRGRLSTLSISAESGVQRVVDEVVGKQLDLRAIVQTAERAHAAQVPVLIHYIIGMPGETRAEINNTLEFALDLFDRFRAEPSVQYATPLPGTRLRREASTRGGTALPLVHDWGPHFQAEPSLSSGEFELGDLKAFKRSFDARLAALREPPSVLLNPTSKCNSRCAFCSIVRASPADLSFDEQTRALLAERRLGRTELKLGGGEPSLNPQLFSLIRFARRAGFTRVELTTNGRMAMYEAYAQRLMASGITELLFSLHGASAQVHDELVGAPGAFEQAIAGIRNCRAAASNPHGTSAVEIGINITLTRKNLSQLGELLELSQSLGVGWVNLLFLVPFGADPAALDPGPSETAAQVLACLEHLRPALRIHALNVPPCFLPGHEALCLGSGADRPAALLNLAPDLPFPYATPEREYRSECASCHHKVVCGGFYKHSEGAVTLAARPRRTLSGAARPGAAHDVEGDV